MSSPHVENIVHHLWRPVEGEAPPHIYALVDAARSEAIYPKIAVSRVEKFCLFRGEKARELAWVAPYLVELQREDPFTRWLLENGWGKSWGIFAASSVEFHKLRYHFRALLMAHNEEGRPLLFRYYDPRVLRVYLPTCNAEELKTVFGPVDAFMLEGEKAEEITEYTCSGEKLLQHTTLLERTNW